MFGEIESTALIVLSTISLHGNRWGLASYGQQNLSEDSQRAKKQEHCVCHLS